FEYDCVRPCPITIRPVWVIALLTRPAITNSTLSIHVVFMNTGHQRPAAASSITEP
ncbi:hypothetical protein M9458_016103, partial [Cirrhinus mrigala]